jgi:hypothetical protein
MPASAGIFVADRRIISGYNKNSCASMVCFFTLTLTAVSFMPIVLRHVHQSNAFGCVPACLEMIFAARNVAENSHIVTQEQLREDCQTAVEPRMTVWEKCRYLLGLFLPRAGTNHGGIVRGILRHGRGVDILCHARTAHGIQQQIPNTGSVRVIPIRQHDKEQAKWEAGNRLQAYIRDDYPVMVMINMVGASTETYSTPLRSPRRNSPDHAVVA